jgi:predicted  nucleic acid-binding Zn-ribbon protein
MMLQNWIQMFFNNESEERKSEYSNDITTLQKHVLLFRNEILYERFLRKQLEDYIKVLKYDNVSSWETKSAHQSLEKRVKYQASEIKRLQEEVQLWKKADRDSRNRLDHWDEKLNTKMTSLTESNQKLTEENLNLNESVDTLRYQIKSLQSELENKNNLIYELKTKSTENGSRLQKLKGKETQLEMLTEEVHMWERSHSKFLTTSRENRELMEGIVFRDKIIEAITAKLDQSREKMHQLSSSLHTKNALITTMKNEAGNYNEQLRKTKNLGDHQLAVVNEKLKALQHKYEALKGYHLALQKKIIQLRSEQQQ